MPACPSYSPWVTHLGLRGGLGWWGGVGGMLERYGLFLTPLGQEEVQALARHLLNPELE